MLLSPKQFSKAFEDIKTTSLTHSTCKLAIFVSCLDVDAICSSKMLSTLLKRHLIVFQLIPVVGYNEVKSKYQKLDDSISNIILIGCGAMVDMESFLEIDVNDYLDHDYYNDVGNGTNIDSSNVRLKRKIYIIDGHRPWNLDNLFGSQMITCLDDGSSEVELEQEKKSYEFLISVDSEAEDEEEEEVVEELASTDEDEFDLESEGRKRKRSSPQPTSNKKRQLSENEKKIEEYYNQGTTISTSSALQTYSLISTIGETNIDYLWLSIVGTTSLNSNFNSIYENLLPLLKEEVNRLQEVPLSQQQQTQSQDNASQLDISRGKKADNNSLYVDKDYSLFLLRHWSLYNSFFYSNYVNAKLQLYTNGGKKKLNTMFARMGISLVQANQNWHYLDIDLKKKLHSTFTKHLKDFLLTDILKDGFVRNFGFNGSVSASDYVESITALLEYDGTFSNSLESNKKSSPSPTTGDSIEEDESNTNDVSTLIQKRESQFVSNFWKSYDSLGKFDIIKRGLTIAKLQQQFIFDKGFEIFQRKMIKNLRIFRLVVLKENFASNNTIMDHHSGSDPSSTGSGMANTPGELENDSIDIKTLNKNSKLFQNPLILTKLGNWILEACAELDQSVLPLVIASLDPETNTYLVCGLPPKYPNMKGMDIDESTEQRQKKNQENNITILNTFSLAFQDIATSTGAKARIDSFDSTMIELRKEDLPIFLEKLSLSGLI